MSAPYKCHSAAEGKAKGGLTLDTRDGLKKGGETGTAIVPGDPDKSLLIQAISYKDADLQMPPKEKLSTAAIADLSVAQVTEKAVGVIKKSFPFFDHHIPRIGGNAGDCFSCARYRFTGSCACL